MYALRLAKDGRILEVMDERYKTEDTPMVEDYPHGEEVNLVDYKYQNGEWVYDPIPVETVPTPQGNADDITDLQLAMAEVYEMMITVMGGI